MALKVKLIKSLEGSSEQQRATVFGLGLRKLGQERLLKDTPPNRGMARAVNHLVQWAVVEGEAPVRQRRKPRKIRVRDAARARQAQAARQ
jgi:large subunit ribosomal protein L30